MTLNEQHGDVQLRVWVTVSVRMRCVSRASRGSRGGAWCSPAAGILVIIALLVDLLGDMRVFSCHYRQRRTRVDAGDKVSEGRIVRNYPTYAAHLSAGRWD